MINKRKRPKRFDHVYHLIDPRTNVVMYVGKTWNPEQRIIQHVRNPSKTTKEWIKSLCGQMPLMRIVWKSRFTGSSCPGGLVEQSEIEAQVNSGNKLLLNHAHNKTKRKLVPVIIDATGDFARTA